MGSSFTTNVAFGGCLKGTSIKSTDSIQSVLKAIVHRNEPPAPPTGYESKNIGTWSSSSDVNTFLNTYNEWNGYNGLKLGNYITIKDGTYNTQWEIAGFNCEHSRKASDGTTYDNGYGLFLIPKTQLPSTMRWNNSNTVTGGYKSSTMHTSNLVTVANKLKSILGDHLINRNVLLSSSVDSNYYSNGYQWTNAYATLMPICQMNGTFASNRNKYDDGEANYKLPLFNHEGFSTDSYLWSRGVWGSNYSYYNAWNVEYFGDIGGNVVTTTFGVRPLILIR